MTCNVTGTAISPNGQIKPGARITFRRAQLDVVSQEGSFVIPDDYIIQTALDGTVDFDILPGVYDATTVAVGGRTVAFRVSVPDEPAADFADLLNASYVEIPPASVTQAQQARDAAIAARDDAELSANNAAISETNAQSYADAAQLAGAAVGTYATTADGIAATTSGQRFWAPSGEYLQLYTNTTGSAVAVANAILPLKSYFDSRFSDTLDLWAVKSADDFIIMRATDSRDIRVNWPMQFGSSVVSETSGQFRLGSLYTVDAPSITGLQFVSDDGFVIFTSESLVNTISME